MFEIDYYYYYDYHNLTIKTTYTTRMKKGEKWELFFLKLFFFE